MRRFLALFMQGMWLGALVLMVLNLIAENTENATLFLLSAFYLDYTITSFQKG